jgi:hypothetical protein
LSQGSDYTVEAAGGGGSWSQYTYRIAKNVFAADGTYIVSAYSEDTAGNINENTAEGKNAEITFGVDATNPSIILTNLEANSSYNETSHEAVVNVSDNLVLEDVAITLNGEAVEASVNNDNYTFQIPESNEKQVVTVTAQDAAGNQVTEEVAGILVSTNAFVRFINNTAAVAGTIAGVVAAGGAGTYVAIHGGIGAWHFRPRKKFTGKKPE